MIGIEGQIKLHVGENRQGMQVEVVYPQGILTAEGSHVRRMTTHAEEAAIKWVKLFSSQVFLMLS